MKRSKAWLQGCLHSNTTSGSRRRSDMHALADLHVSSFNWHLRFASAMVTCRQPWRLA